MEITLDQLLTSRENRHARQQELLRQYPGQTLLCVTVIIPGSVKRNTNSLIIAGAATTAVVNRFGNSIRHIDSRDLATGHELFVVTDIDNATAKKMACEIEETHPLGRLFDIDVINSQGFPLSREEAGHKPRRCLLCDNEARYCMRNHTHTRQELDDRISQMISDYVQ